MELSRYVDLFLAESQEHLRELGRSLLLLESGGDAGAVDRAFRAAHTLKGMSATMGFRAVTELAHAMEDRLAELRAGLVAGDADLVDRLLAQSDALERAIADVAVGEAPGAPPAAAPPPPMAAPRAAGPGGVPAGTVLVAAVTLSPEAALPAARAAIVRRNVEAVARVLGADPDPPGEDFRGTYRLFLGRGADVAAVEAAARAAGEIENVVVAVPRTVDRLPGRASGEHAPRTTHVRVELSRLDELANGLGELGVLGAHLRELAAGGSVELREQLDRTLALVEALRETALATRMVPVGELFERFPRLVRDVARALGKEVELRVEGREIELDRAVVDAVAEPLVHLLRNAVDHGLESPAERVAAGKPARGRVALRVFRERTSVRILVEDDGAGVDARLVAERARALGLIGGDDPDPASGDALLRLLASPGFSLAERVTELSGRGVGLDAVVASLRSVGGSLGLHTVPGQGSTFTLRLPLSLAVAPALRVRVGGEEYAVAMTHVREVVELKDVPRARVRGREVIRLRGEVVALLRLGALLGAPGTRDRETAAIVAEVGERRAALAVDELVAREQVVVKPFDAANGMLPFFSGATLLADGRPALVLDPVTVL